MNSIAVYVGFRKERSLANEINKDRCKIDVIIRLNAVLNVDTVYVT